MSLAWHCGRWWCSTIPRLVIKGSAVEEIQARWTVTGILKFSCDLDLDHNWAIQSFHKTVQAMIMCHQTRFCWKRISSSEDILESNILIAWSSTVTLNFKTTNRYFWNVLWLMKMHNYKNFGNKRFSGSEVYRLDKHLKFCCDFCFERCNPISP